MSVLKINGCAICGYDKCHTSLAFHHTNPSDKQYQVTFANLDKKDLAGELNKCILFCANCHGEVEEKQRGIK